MKNQNTILLDSHYTDSTRIKRDNFEDREQAILERIKIHYSLKLGREIDNEETKEIAENLLQFMKALYGA